MVTKIIIRERGDDYMAFIEDHPEIWGCGKGVAGAVGDLVLSHQETCNIKIEYERDYEKLKKEMSEQKTKRKMEERLKIGQEIICPKHGVQVIEAIDISVPQETLYVLSCGDIHHPAETGEEKIRIGRRKGPYSNWG